MVLQLLDWLVVFLDTETEQLVKIRVQAGTSVAAINTAMKAIDDGNFGRRTWMVLESCETVPDGDCDA